MALRLGIDVGGTNTDAVLLDQSHTVLGHAKALTTPDVLSGILAAVCSLLASTPAGSCPPHSILPLPWISLVVASSLSATQTHHPARSMCTSNDSSPTSAEPGDVGLACLGTTHFINAVIRRQGLARVAVLRLCGPATVALPPFCDMPSDLCAAIGCSYRLLSGMALLLP